MNLKEYSSVSEEERTEHFAKECNHIEQDKKSMKQSVSSLKRWIDGEPVNVNPLAEIPEPEMRLYSIGNNYFQTIDELLQYCRINKISTNGLEILEYHRNLADCSDVIRRSNGQIWMLYTAVDRDGYCIYNHKRSVYRGKFTWEYSHGSIRKMYRPFRDRGIVFENDIYAEQAERDKQFLKMCREKNLLGVRK